MLNDAGNLPESRGQASRVGNEAEIAIQEVVSLIGKAGLVRLQLLHPQFRLPLEFRHFIHNPGRGERRDFQGDAAAAKLRNAFGRIRNHQEAPRRSRQNFFAQERAACAFDQAQIRSDFVGAVDGEIDANPALRFAYQYAELSGARRGLQRRSKGLDFEFSLANRFAHERNQIVRR
jgi:hypothetical protein